jgi:5-methylcytosine-specific restriction endonuclease McrA
MARNRKSGDKFYDSVQWNRIRREILVRDQYLCRIRGPYCQGTADRVDHVIPRAKGGGESPSNLRAACGPCNSRKKDRIEEPVHTVEW